MDQKELDAIRQLERKRIAQNLQPLLNKLQADNDALAGRSDYYGYYLSIKHQIERALGAT